MYYQKWYLFGSSNIEVPNQLCNHFFLIFLNPSNNVLFKRLRWELHDTEQRALQDPVVGPSAVVAGLPSLVA
jgi:hypothetical protein